MYNRCPREEDLAKKDEKLGVLNAKDKQIFKDGKQAGRTELLDLIKDELSDINFAFLYKEGEIASLALPLEIDNNETVVELASPEVVIISEVVVEPTNGIRLSQASTEPAFFEAVLESTTRTLPTQATDTTWLLRKSTQGYEDQGNHPYGYDLLPPPQALMPQLS
ncbi:Uncharacterized protein Fot_10463 [Forsythia ovata]|uniref:Uncharacterized protein n=1 Tax=Forsythia ovata TaxID=205694 RepID=A0ABD1WJH8_9LAMI